jgi:hypothetical protein
MWLFTSKGFVSVVQDRDNNDNLLVRARVKSHLQALFPQGTVIETQDADYLFRCSLQRKLVEQVMADQVNAIDYGNFKDTVVDPDYHSACLRCWSSLHQLQLQKSVLW